MEGLWQLEVPPKVKLFIWKALHNTLPSISNLVSRGMEIENQCPRCYEEKETVEHALFDCSCARDLWALCILEILSFETSSILLPSIWERLMADLSPSTVALAVMVCWALWNDRNRGIGGNTVCETSERCGWILTYVESYQKFSSRRVDYAKRFKDLVMDRSVSIPSVWLLCHVDAACDPAM